MTALLPSGILMGLLATIAMDLWALALNRFAKEPLPNWAMPGRWVGHLPRGTVFHDKIADATSIQGELTIGWVFHYAVGITYGIVLALIMGPAWLAQPSFTPAFIFSIATIGFGWFLLQPGLGLGWAASKTPNPWKVRSMNIAAHSIFACGLWVGALL